MPLEELGYHPQLEQFQTDHQLQSFEIGRVIAEHKERYLIRTGQGEYEAEITGNMRFTAQRREDFPAVGDWVAATIYDAGQAIIHLSGSCRYPDCTHTTESGCAVLEALDRKKRAKQLGKILKDYHKIDPKNRG